MKIRHLRIERFRGIRELDWEIGGDFACLVGPGDSRKSTVLDAIDLALSARWNMPFDDADFYDLDTSQPISIVISVGQIPEDLMSDAKYGLCLTGYCNGEVHDELKDDDEPVLTIRLQVNSSLEPEWTVINKQNPEGRPISGRDRERLGIMRLGGYTNFHLGWGRGTVLSKLTGKLDDIDSILAEASRAAKQNIPVEKLSQFTTAAKKVQTYGEQFGVTPSKGYAPHLDMRAVNIRNGGFTLHDGDVPIRRAGLGDRRLLIMAMQRQMAEFGGLILIDEFEYGLEPHRIRHLLRILRNWSKTEDFGQIFLTAHSPVVAEELPEHLNIVRTDKMGNTTIKQASQSLVPAIRSAPESLLGRKVIVCEGKTEVGICRALDEYWCQQDGKPFACRGVVPVEGGGTSAPSVALHIVQLGYEVAFLGDSDTEYSNERDAELENSSIRVFTWKDGLATEERVIRDLPWAGVAAILKLAIEFYGEESVKDAIAARLQKKGTEFEPIENWTETSELRQAIGITAKQKDWFKRIDLGEDLGRVIVQHISSIPNSGLAEKIQSLRNWIEP